MTSESDKSSCRRCGTCCKKGGPSFHLNDRAIIDSGAIQLKHLYTIREKELAWDNVRGGVLPAPTDIIKIKSRSGGRVCVFHDEVTAACTVYTHRPAECRALNCRDTRGIEAIYEKNRLTRKELLEGVAGLWELVEDHQMRCSYDTILPLAEEVRKQTRADAVQELLYLVRYDLHFRDLVVQKGGTDPEMLDFLFGRPLTVTLKSFGIEIRQKEGKLVIGLKKN